MYTPTHVYGDLIPTSQKTLHVHYKLQRVNAARETTAAYSDNHTEMFRINADFKFKK
jgi:hypothetical protein